MICKMHKLKQFSLLIIILLIFASARANTNLKMSPEEISAHAKIYMAEQQKLNQEFNPTKFFSEYLPYAIPLDMKVSTEGGGNAKFSIALYKALTTALDDRENLIFSPVSIALTLGKLALGTRGRTAEEIRDALAIADLDYIADLPEALETQREVLEQVESWFELQRASAIFCDENLQVEEEFITEVKHHYGGDIHEITLNQDKIEENTKHIQAWVAQETNSDSTSLDIDIENTSNLFTFDSWYFEGIWDKKFQPENTKDRDFTLQTGETVQVQMMQQKNRFFFGHKTDLFLKFVEIPLLARELSMFVFISQTSDHDDPSLTFGEVDWEDHFEEEFITNPHKAFQILPSELTMNLQMPKLNLECTVDAVDALQVLGITKLFSPDAELPGISVTHNARVERMFQRLVVSLDEQGSKRPTEPIDSRNLAKMQKKDVELSVDRPFTFFIRENKSKLVLLMGKINNLRPNIRASHQRGDKNEL